MSVRALASKAPEHIARLAGTFAVFEGDDEVHEEQVDRALRLMLHYLDEAQRLWGAGQIKPELRLAQELLQWWRTKVGPAGSSRSPMSIAMVPVPFAVLP